MLSQLSSSVHPSLKTYRFSLVLHTPSMMTLSSRSAQISKTSSLLRKLRTLIKPARPWENLSRWILQRMETWTVTLKFKFHSRHSLPHAKTPKLYNYWLIWTTWSKLLMNLSASETLSGSAVMLHALTSIRNASKLSMPLSREEHLNSKPSWLSFSSISI